LSGQVIEVDNLSGHIIDVDNYSVIQWQFSAYIQMSLTQIPV